MSIKITIPNTSSDVLTFGSANTPTAAQIAGIDSGSSNGQLALYTTASGTSNERVRVDASGNVGIGTSSPTDTSFFTRALDLNGTSGAGYYARTNSSATNYTLFGNYGSDGYINNRGSGSFIVFNNGSERARIDTSGNLLVGTTAGYNTRLAVLGPITDGNVGVACFRSSTAADTSLTCISIVKASSTTTTSQVLVRFGIDNYNSGSGQINANGAGAAAFGAFSDSRLKENIVDLPSQLDNIMALRPVEYDYIESEGGGHQIGFVAQEVKAIYPDLVGERADGMLTLSDMNKNDARLIKAIQEMKAIIDTQDSTITSLTDRITALEGAK
jgi:hypothetical protein